MIIEWDMNDPAQKALWEYWQSLTETGQAGKWARETLLAGASNRRMPLSVSPVIPARPTVHSYPKPGAKKANGASGSVEYRDVEDEP